MARGDKTLARMRANPRDWRIANLEAVAAASGVNIRENQEAVTSCSSIRI